jgi:two-component system response regulator RegA
MKNKILIIDDEKLFGESLAQELSDCEQFQSHYISHPNEAMQIMEEDFHIILMDLRLQNTSGLNHIEEIKSIWPNSQLYIMTGYGTIATAVSAMKLGATDYLTKPITPKKVQELLENKTVAKEDKGLEEPMSLDRVEREYIEHVLAQEKGNISKAAQKLGLHRQSLQRKLKKWVPFK